MSRRALVTGASGGLGLEFAKLLAADGYDLVLVARSRDKLDDVATALRAACGVAVEVVVQDLASANAAAQLQARVPQCDVLVNNAGFATAASFVTIPPERTRGELQLDVVTLTELTRLYLPGMLERRDGKILNVASTAGLLPGPFAAVYYAAKAYVISFSEALWYELRGSGVSVTCFAPGATATGFSERAGAGTSLLFKLPVADAAKMAQAGYRGMQQGRRLVIPGLTNNVLALLSRVAPRRPLLWVSAKTIQPKGG